MGLLFAVIGYFVGTIAGCFAIEEFSSNTHDRSLEAAMTSVFAIGPIAALIGLIAGIVFGGRRTRPTQASDLNVSSESK
jgi:hypothetical protein